MSKITVYYQIRIYTMQNEKCPLINLIKTLNREWKTTVQEYNM